MTETHLSENKGTLIEGYTFFGRARAGKAGGGVGIFVETNPSWSWHRYRFRRAGRRSVDVSVKDTHELVMLMLVHRIISIYLNDNAINRGDDKHTKNDIICSFEKRI